MQINFGNTYLGSQQDTATADGFNVCCAHSVSLPAGPMSALVQIQLHRRTVGALVRVRVLSNTDIVPIGAESRHLKGDNDDDRVFVRFIAPSEGIYQIIVEVDASAEAPMLRLITIVDGHVSGPDDPAFHFSASSLNDVSGINCVILGTTTRCPASCINCPTNKPITALVPKGVMGMPLFCSIIDGLEELKYAGTIVFGLYGEPLLDPHLNERLAYIRTHLPDAAPLLATTGSIYDPARHESVIKESGGLAVHVEAFSPALYDRRMTPLRHKSAMPRIERLLETARQRGHLVMPLNRENLQEISDVVRLSLRLGAAKPDFSALSNRCGENPLFDHEALAPIAACCSPEKIQSELVIDWDGTVVACCFDFLRHGRLGSVADGGVKAFLESATRHAAIERFRRKEWAAMPACRHCRCDDALAVARIAQAETQQKLNEIELPFSSFMLHENVERLDGCLVYSRPVLPESDAAIRVWGPYWRFPPGRYAVDLQASFTEWDTSSFARVELILNLSVVEAVDLICESDAGKGVRLVMDCDEDDLMELRIATRNLSFRIESAAMSRVSNP